MMVPHFAEHFAGIMMTDRDNRREKHVIARRHTLQGVVRLFIHVEESRLKPWQLEISGSAQDCAGVSKRTRQMFQAEFCLRKCFGIFIASLWKVKNSQFWFSLKETTDERDAIHLLRVTIVIEGEHKISSRLPHNNIREAIDPRAFLFMIIVACGACFRMTFTVSSAQPSAVINTSTGGGSSAAIISQVRCKAFARLRVVIMIETVNCSLQLCWIFTKDSFNANVSWSLSIHQYPLVFNNRRDARRSALLRCSDSKLTTSGSTPASKNHFSI